MTERNDLSITLLRGRLDGDQKNRLAKLLNMLYSPSELAEEVGFSARQVYRVYIKAGCPFEKDEKGHIWINGKEFRGWITEIYKKQDIGPTEAYCLTCKKAVRMLDPERLQEDRLIYYLCKCPNCGRKLARIITRGKRLE